MLRDDDDDDDNLFLRELNT